MKSLSFALRLCAIFCAIAVAGSVIQVWLSDYLFGNIGTALDADGRDAIFEQLATLSKVYTAFQILCALLLVVGATYLLGASKAQPGRTLAMTLSVVFFALTLYVFYAHWGQQVRYIERDSAAFWLRAIISLTRLSCIYGFFAAVLVVGVRQLEAKTSIGRKLLVIYTLLAATSIALAAHSWFSPPSSSSSESSWRWLIHAFHLAPDIVFVIAAFWAAGQVRRLPNKPSSLDEPKTRSAISGEPLRLLAWAILARIGAGVLGQILFMWQMRSRHMDAAQSVLILMTLVNLTTSIVIATALVRYRRYPIGAVSRGAITFAFGAIGAGILLELAVTASLSQLLGLASEARRASSSWPMPSLSRIESLTTFVLWGGRLSLLLGVAALWCVISSVRRTTNWLQSIRLSSRAGRVMGLAIAAGVGAILLSFLANARIGVAGLLLAAGVLLVVALFMLVDWLGLLFSLANELERDPATRQTGPAADDEDDVPESEQYEDDVPESERYEDDFMDPPKSESPDHDESSSAPAEPSSETFPELRSPVRRRRPSRSKPETTTEDDDESSERGA